MRKFIFIAPLFLSLFSYGQYASVELKEEDAKKIGEVSKGATLILAINNEKDPSDAALISAVKNYWKLGKYKFISRAEFFTLQGKNELSKSDLYLYETAEYDYNIHSIENPALLSNVKTGVFCLSLGDQVKKVTRVSGMKFENTSAVKLKFDLSGTLTNSKDRVNDGYLNVMVKYFNHEVEFCQKLASVKDVKKEEKDGIVFFDDGKNDIQNKDILLIKEQVNKSKLSDKKESKKSAPINAVAQFNPPTKNVYTVFPEDIRMAISKSDKKVLIYTNDMLINALDGSVAAAPMNVNETGSKGDPKFWAAALGIFASALLIAVILK
ncbi:MAG: hypothetical protein ACXVO9_07930 [Bacteroidia bacterium]